MAGRALDISKGGTSQTTAPGARIALGLEIGVDVQAWDANLDALSALSDVNDLVALEGLSTTGIAVRSAANTWVTRTLQAPTAGFTITNPAGIAGDPTFVLANDLGAIEALNTNAILVRTGTDTWAARTLTAPAAGLTITNPAGTAGNPTFALANDLSALEGLSTTGLIARTAADTMTTRTITGTANKITATNGDGVSGNPTLTIPDAVTLVDATISSSLILPQSTTPTPTAEGSIAWDTDDNAIVVGDSSAQKIFRANNWELISTSNPSSAASVVFTGLSAYRLLRLIGWYIPATDAVGFDIQTSTDNGSTYATTLGDYITNYLFQNGATASATSTANDSGVEIFATGVGNTAPESGFFDALIFEFNQAKQCHFLITFGELNTSTSGFVGIMQARRTNSTARDALRCIPRSGNISSGHFELWGTRGTA